MHYISAEGLTKSYGINPLFNNITFHINEGDKISLDEDEFTVLFTPGHSPGSISFYNSKQGFIISGDVLFFKSIGRTDFPNCSHELLIDSIKTKLFSLPPETVVYSGHGRNTSIGFEIKHNPFLQ